MVDHTLKIPTPVVFGVKCFDCDTTELYLRNNPAWNKDDIEVVMFIRTPCIYIKRNIMYV